MAMQLTGTIKHIGKLEQISDRFKKKEVVITDNSSQYPQHILFQLTQDKTHLIDQYDIGEEITVHFNLRGKEWQSKTGETKYFNTLEIWRIAGESSENIPAAENSVSKSTAYDDSLPF